MAIAVSGNMETLDFGRTNNGWLFENREQLHELLLV